MGASDTNLAEFAAFSRMIKSQRGRKGPGGVQRPIRAPKVVTYGEFVGIICTAKTI